MSIKMVGTLVVKRYILKTWNNVRQASKSKCRTDITLYTFSFSKSAKLYVTVHQTFSDSAIMKQSLLHKRLLTTSGRYVHKKDDYSGYSEQYCYFCEKRPLVLA